MKWVIAIVAIFLLPSWVWAVDHTVCSSGCDHTTIQACDDWASRGDSCTVSAGTYAERVTVTTAASGTDTITFTADGVVNMQGFLIQADYIIVDGFTISNPTDCSGETTWLAVKRACAGVQIEGDYVTVQNNTITNCEGEGISAATTGYTTPLNATITNNTISYTGLCGIKIHGANHLVNDNEISHTVQLTSDTLRASGGADSDGIRAFGDSHTIRNNYVHDILFTDTNNQSDTNAASHIDCFQTWGPATNIVYERNTCVDSTATGGVQGMIIVENNATVNDFIIRYNVFATLDNAVGYGPAITISYDGAGGGEVENFDILNNTIVNQGGDYSNYGIRLREVNGGSIKNNIFYNCGYVSSSYIYVESDNLNLDIGYNLVYSTGDAPSGGAYMDVTDCTAADTPYDCCTAAGEGATCAETDIWMDDPEFSNFSANNFHLQSTSPAIDAGTDLSLTTDCDGNTVPVGALPDIGAYEYDPATIRGCTISGGSIQ